MFRNHLSLRVHVGREKEILDLTACFGEIRIYASVSLCQHFNQFDVQCKKNLS